MIEQIPSHTKVLSDVKLANQLAQELGARHKDYPDEDLLQVNNFLSQFILDTAIRLADRSALLEFQIQSGMV